MTIRISRNSRVPPGGYTPIKPYPIPYRCFYSRNVPNLFMADRNINTTHAGLAPVRVQNTNGMMGTVVGRAAAQCWRLQCEPRAIYEKHLAAFLAFLENPGISTLPPQSPDGADAGKPKVTKPEL